MSRFAIHAGVPESRAPKNEADLASGLLKCNTAYKGGICYEKGQLSTQVYTKELGHLG